MDEVEPNVEQRLLSGMQVDLRAEPPVLEGLRQSAADDRRALPAVQSNGCEPQLAPPALAPHFPAPTLRDASHLQHRREVRVEAKLDLDRHGIARMGADADAFDHRIRQHATLGADAQRLQRKLLALKRQLGIGEFIHRRGAGGVGGDQQPRLSTADSQLVPTHEAGSHSGTPRADGPLPAATGRHAVAMQNALPALISVVSERLTSSLMPPERPLCVAHGRRERSAAIASR